MVFIAICNNNAHIATYRSPGFNRTASASFDTGGLTGLVSLTACASQGQGETVFILRASNGLRDLSNLNAPTDSIETNYRDRSGGL